MLVARPGTPAAADLLFRIVRHELLTRLPDAVVVPVSSDRVEGFDTVVTVGDGPAANGAAVVVVDESIAVLAPRVLDAGVLERRWRVARSLGWDEVVSPNPRPETSPTEDVLGAALHGGASAVADPVIGRAVAALRGPVDPDAASAADARFDELADRITAAADARWGSADATAPRAWAAVRSLHEHLRTLAAAYDERGRRLQRERVAMADEVTRLLELERELRDDRGLERLEAELADARRELDRLRGERALLQADLARALEQLGGPAGSWDRG